MYRRAPPRGEAKKVFLWGESTATGRVAGAPLALRYLRAVREVRETVRRRQHVGGTGYTPTATPRFVNVV